MPMLRIISGPDNVDPIVGPAELGEPTAVALRGLRVLISERAFIGPINPELLHARERAARALESAGARIQTLALKQMRAMLGPTLATLSDGGNASLWRYSWRAEYRQSHYPPSSGPAALIRCRYGWGR